MSERYFLYLIKKTWRNCESNRGAWCKLSPVFHRIVDFVELCTRPVRFMMTFSNYGAIRMPCDLQVNKNGQGCTWREDNLHAEVRLRRSGGSFISDFDVAIRSRKSFATGRHTGSAFWVAADFCGCLQTGGTPSVLERQWYILFETVSLWCSPAGGLQQAVGKYSGILSEDSYTEAIGIARLLSLTS